MNSGRYSNCGEKALTFIFLLDVYCKKFGREWIAQKHFLSSHRALHPKTETYISQKSTLPCNQSGRLS